MAIAAKIVLPSNVDACAFVPPLPDPIAMKRAALRRAAMFVASVVCFITTNAAQAQAPAARVAAATDSIAAVLRADSIPGLAGCSAP